MDEIKKNIIVNKKTLEGKIHVVRGQQVMLDSDLAAIYGYETKYLNLQVKHNMNRFPEDFMFQLTSEEYYNLKLNFSTSSHGGRRKLPYVFTEQGIYQLATVLKGKQAEQQSVAIMRTFKAMREYIAQNRQLLPQQELMRLSGKQAMLEGVVREIKENMVTRTDLSELMELFDSSREAKEILILDGEVFKADVAYQAIFKKAKRNIVVVDDYIGLKTLHHLTVAKNTVSITVISDNKGINPLRQIEFNDFLSEYPDKDINFIESRNKVHDRYIMLDYGSKQMKVYLCGSSSKDSGKKITTIIQVKDITEYVTMITRLLHNPPLQLR
ncbi:MAG: ORF6N domain-containing protein [Faecalicoccus sp.]|nr:ORF6N domain-containing protein [Faecalicoccus sp.]